MKTAQFYQFLGSIALISAIVIYGFQVSIGHTLTKYDLIILLVLISVCLALLRPKWFATFVARLKNARRLE